MDIKHILSLSQEELEVVVRKKLEYLIEEGLVVQIGNKFRLKTQNEQDCELADLLAD